MTSPQPQDWKRRFQNLKIEIERATSGSPGSESLNQIEVDAPSFGIDAIGRGYQQFVSWFTGIPASGKLLAIAGGGLLSMTLIKTVFQLITSLITLSVFGVILYVIYRFWVVPKSSEE